MGGSRAGSSSSIMSVVTVSSRLGGKRREISSHSVHECWLMARSRQGSPLQPSARDCSVQDFSNKLLKRILTNCFVLLSLVR